MPWIFDTLSIERLFDQHIEISWSKVRLNASELRPGGSSTVLQGIRSLSLRYALTEHIAAETSRDAIESRETQHPRSFDPFGNDRLPVRFDRAEKAPLPTPKILGGQEK